jgi:hypothetical protein
MKILQKLKQNMCMSKVTVAKGFRVTLRSDPTVRKGVCCGSLSGLRQKIAKKFPAGSGELEIFTDDGTEVLSNYG